MNLATKVKNYGSLVKIVCVLYCVLDAIVKQGKTHVRACEFFEKFSLFYFNFVVCYPCKSSPSLTILVSLWFIIISVGFLSEQNVIFRFPSI